MCPKCLYLKQVLSSKEDFFSRLFMSSSVNDSGSLSAEYPSGEVDIRLWGILAFGEQLQLKEKYIIDEGRRFSQ